MDIVRSLLDRVTEQGHLLPVVDVNLPNDANGIYRNNILVNRKSKKLFRLNLPNGLEAPTAKHRKKTKDQKIPLVGDLRRKSNR